MGFWGKIYFVWPKKMDMMMDNGPKSFLIYFLKKFFIPFFHFSIFLVQH